MAEMTFQEIIEALNSYWSRYCIIQQPYDLGWRWDHESGYRSRYWAEPWNVAYVEPSAGLQMADGENPNGCSITISTR